MGFRRALERIQSAGSVQRFPTSEKEGEGSGGGANVRRKEGESVKGRKYTEERGEEKGDGGQRGGREIRERLEVDGGVVGG